MGDPREPTDPAILQALRDGVRERMGYPAAAGLPELRDAIAAWVGRRFEVTLDPDRHVIPTLGSKEAIFSFAQVVLDRDGRDTVVVTEPGYPVPGRGAAFAGARVVELPLLEENGFLPASTRSDDDVWDRASLVWLNTPNNPTGAVAPRDFLARLAGLARAHDFVLASDEAYSELWFDEPPPSALELDDWTNVVVFNTLSKRSSMTGFRSGFVAGDPELITALRRFRPNVGTAPQEFVQRASVVAWGDEEHVSARGRRTRGNGRCSSTSCSERGSATRVAPRRCTSGSGCPTVRRRRRTRSASSSTASSWHRALTSVRPVRVTCAMRSCRPRTSAVRRSRCWTMRCDARGANRRAVGVR